MVDIASSATTYDFRFHLGPHSPLSLPLQRLLARNDHRLAEVDAECPPAKMHRDVLNKILKLPSDKLSDRNTQQIYLDSVLQNDHTRQVIYNFDAFLGSRKNALKQGAAYPSLEKKVFPLRQLTAAHKVTVFLCLQSYAQFVEAELAGIPDLRNRLASNPDNLNFSWVPFVSRLRAVWPEAMIVVLEAENLAPQWAANIALITGHPNTQTFDNIEKFPVKCLCESGRNPYMDSLSNSPPATVGKWVDATSQFFTQYGHHKPILNRIVKRLWTPEQLNYSEQKFDSDKDQLKTLGNVALATELIEGLQ